jgi:hypothetical protein
MALCDGSKNTVWGRGIERSFVILLGLRQDSVVIVNVKRGLLSRQIFVFQSWYFIEYWAIGCPK